MKPCLIMELKGDNITGLGDEKAVQASSNIMRGTNLCPYIGYIVDASLKKQLLRDNAGDHLMHLNGSLMIDPMAKPRIVQDVGYLALSYPEHANLGPMINTVGEATKSFVSNNCKIVRSSCPGHLVWLQVSRQTIMKGELLN